MTTFAGKLTKEELQILRESLVKEKDIRKIEKYIAKYKDSIEGYRDLVGDKIVPSKVFYYNIKHYGHLLENDPTKALSKEGVIIRKKIIWPIIKALGPLFLNSKQVIENRNNLKDIDNNEPDKEIILPKEPVIWTSNHHFKEDALGAFLATKRSAYFLFGSVPQFYNTFDGILVNAAGAIMINRKNQKSRKASIEKIKYLFSLGEDLIMYPEGVHNKTPNKLLLDLYKGIYEISCETGVQVVPVIHYIKDPTEKIDSRSNPIHTVVDDPIDLGNFSMEGGLNYLKEVMGTWYYLMMERYGKESRAKLMKHYENRALTYNDDLILEDFEQKPITFEEAWEIYLYDLNSIVDGYDSTIERAADYRPKNILRPEDAFESIANIGKSNKDNVWNVVEASNLVRTRKQEDFQRRF